MPACCYIVKQSVLTVCPDDLFECSHGRVGDHTSLCISSDKRCDRVTDCLGGEDELEHNCPCGPEGAVRLVDSIVPYRGRVEICQHGRWMSLCGQWNNNNAAVVCRQLGYPTQGLIYTHHVYSSIFSFTCST